MLYRQPSFVPGQTLAVDGGISAGAGRGAPPAVRQFFSDQLPDGLGRLIAGAVAATS